MGLNSKKKSGTSKSTKEKGESRNVFQILEGKEGNSYAKASSYKGRLIWEDFGGEDEPNDGSKFFVVGNISLFEPGDKDPEFVKLRGVINLKNEKSATPLEESDNSDSED